ncbi:MAG: lactate utilization protein [Candidatus Nanohalobium sp.]
MPKTKQDFIGELDIETEKYDSRPSQEKLEETVRNLENNNFDVKVVEDREEALEAVKDEIEDEASVMTGHSTTLEEIGFIDYLNTGGHSWKNLYGKVFSIDDDEERNRQRRKAQASDYFLGSLNAIASTGELVAADRSGSRVGAYPFAAENLVLVSGTNKITEDLEAARERLWKYAYRLENERAKAEYGAESAVAKELTFRQDSPGRTTLILVKETLGF